MYISYILYVRQHDSQYYITDDLITLNILKPNN